MSERIHQSLLSIMSEVSIIRAELDKTEDDSTPPEVEEDPGLLHRFPLVDRWKSTSGEPVNEQTFLIPAGYSRLELEMTIEVGPWHPELSDGIHGLFWLFEGDWDRTFGYAICRGPKRNRVSFLTKRGWGRAEAGQARTGWHFAAGDEVSLRATFRPGGSSLVGSLVNQLRVPAGQETEEPFGDAKLLTLWLGNPDDRDKGAHEVPSVGWIWKNVELSLWK